MAFCPCCFGFPRQVACKIVAILDMIFATFGGLTGFLLLGTFIFYRDELQTELDNDERMGKNYELRSFMEKPVGVQYSFIVFVILICAVELVVAFILFKGARTRNAAKCTIWFRIHCILLLLGIVFNVLAILASQEKLVISVAACVGLLYQAYSLWVVNAYVQELNSVRGSMKRIDNEEQAEPLQDMNSKP